MKIENIISGIILTTIGVALGYIDYFIVSSFYSISSWIQIYLNAPDSLAILLTIGLSWVFIGLLLIVGIIGLYVFILGLILMFSD